MPEKSGKCGSRATTSHAWLQMGMKMCKVFQTLCHCHKFSYGISSYKTRGYYFFRRPSTRGLLECGYYLRASIIFWKCILWKLKLAFCLLMKAPICNIINIQFSKSRKNVFEYCPRYIEADICWDIIRMWVLFEGGSYMRKYGS